MVEKVLRLKDRIIFNQNYDEVQAPKSHKNGLYRHIRDVVYMKTNGKCYYCGVALNRPGWNGPKKKTFTIDHKTPKGAGGSNKLKNLVPSCKKCNNLKGMNDIDGFRWTMSKLRFEQENGIRFSDEQFKWLELNGRGIDLPEHIFWFETNLPKIVRTKIDQPKVSK